MDIKNAFVPSEKKVEVEINGRKVRVMPHLVNEMIKYFGANTLKQTKKETPKELLQLPGEKPKELLIIPISETEKKSTVLPEMILTDKPKEATIVKPARKTPVKSRSKK